MRTDEEILAALARAAEGLWYMSESDYPLEPVRLEGPEEPSHERLRELAGKGPDAGVETRSLEEFFRTAAAVRMPPAGAGEPASPGTFHAVIQTLKENLTDLRIYRVGEINIPVYVLGKSPSGNWLGLSTRVVET
ncbi:MAG TPA: nuclease A inhibitor family protein [Pyrinomonadaceae bacterium]|nr:nuclease A inhibitor family protein [Pyrinomonadaceae bacterium]